MTGVARIKALEALGRAITPPMIEGTMALFAAAAPRPTPDVCLVRRDLSYGGDARHRLDVFSPLERSTPRPALIFVHGGGFVAGDKGGADAPFYNNIGAWAARHGCVGVTMTYRLAPGAPWPAGSDDVALAVGWLQQHAAEFGVDPRGLFVMGQSAGAAHVAGYIADVRHGAAEAVAGAIFMSGIYDLTRLTHSPFERAYYGEDATRFVGQSSLPGLLATSEPCLYSVAEFDPENFQRQADQVNAAHLEATGALPRMLYFTGHNHLSPALSLGGPDDDIGPSVASFIERFTRPPSR
jgi:triacylglycerol lipase